MTYRDEAGDFAVHNVLRPRGIVFRPDLTGDPARSELPGEGLVTSSHVIAMGE